MIRKPDNWENVQAFSDRKKLPLGAYVCTVLKATVANGMNGDVLQIGFDIAEGEYQGYYREEFAASTYNDKKWKGVLRVFLPRYDGSEADELTKRNLKGMVTAVEQSNPGYVWNWDESTLVGKKLGIIFRQEEWEFNGRSGWATHPFRATSVDSVRDGSFTLPKDKPVNGNSAGISAPVATYAAPTPETGGYTMVEECELPF